MNSVYLHYLFSKKMETDNVQSSRLREQKASISPRHLSEHHTPARQLKHNPQQHYKYDCATQRKSPQASCVSDILHCNSTVERLAWTAHFVTRFSEVYKIPAKSSVQFSYKQKET